MFSDSAYSLHGYPDLLFPMFWEDLQQQFTEHLQHVHTFIYYASRDQKSDQKAVQFELRRGECMLT